MGRFIETEFWPIEFMDRTETPTKEKSNEKEIRVRLEKQVNSTLSKPKPVVSMRKVLGELADNLTKEWHDLAFRGENPELVLVMSKAPTAHPLKAVKWIPISDYNPRDPDVVRANFRWPHIHSDEYIRYCTVEALRMLPVLNSERFEYET
jgi:hypothetical protein